MYRVLSPPGRAEASQPTNAATRPRSAAAGTRSCRRTSRWARPVRSSCGTRMSRLRTLDLDDTVSPGGQTARGFPRCNCWTAAPSGYFVTCSRRGRRPRTPGRSPPDRVTVPHTVARLFFRNCGRPSHRLPVEPVDRSMMQVADGVGKNTCGLPQRHARFARPWLRYTDRAEGLRSTRSSRWRANTPGTLIKSRGLRERNGAEGGYRSVAVLHVPPRVLSGYSDWQPAAVRSHARCRSRSSASITNANSTRRGSRPAGTRQTSKRRPQSRDRPARTDA